MANGRTAARTEAGGAWSLAARCLTALLGGYAAASGAAALIARLAPITRVEATAWALIVSFLIYAGLALWAFAEPRLARVATVVWGAALASIGAALVLGVRP